MAALSERTRPQKLRNETGWWDSNLRSVTMSRDKWWGVPAHQEIKVSTQTVGRSAAIPGYNQVGTGLPPLADYFTFYILWSSVRFVWSAPHSAYRGFLVLFEVLRAHNILQIVPELHPKSQNNTTYFEFLFNVILSSIKFRNDKRLYPRTSAWINSQQKNVKQNR